MTSAPPITAAQQSIAGVKPENEDACGIRVPEPAQLATKGLAAVVCDGISGSEAGREAAESCVQGFLNDYFSTPDSWTVETSGHKVLTALNRWLYGQGQQRYGHPAMVTTFSALVVKSASAYLFHVGDSRIYLFRGGDLECLTHDHRAQVTRDKNYLSRALGIELHMEIDFRTLPVEVGDLFVLTTDGVHDFLDDARLRALIRTGGHELEKLCQAIVAAAMESGSSDNITCQVVRIDRLLAEDPQDVYQKLTELPFPPPLEPGHILDGYRVVRELHASARTQVYLAVDEETGEKVVLKTPSVNYEDDPAYINAFLHEEWAGRRIDSPHVLRVLEPRRKRQFLYVVTEYVEGRTLRQWMHDHRSPALADVRDIAGQIAAGLRAFHRLEMIHQDLKPENIVIDTEGTVKIIDFGSIKIAGIEEIATPLERNNLLGTRNYTAPEYLRGFAGTNRSDIYSLGVIVYEMLTGRLPYGRELTPRNLKRVRYRPAADHNPEVPVWMDGALEKAVAIDPTRRYERLSEFTYDLSHPNPAFTRQGMQPLLERNPTAFWKGLALVSLLANLVLLVQLLRT